MPRNMPSITALLALLALAGYQNRAKIGQMIRNAGQAPTRFQPEDPGAAGATATLKGGVSGILSDIGALFTGTGGSGALADGIDQLVNRFRNAGQSAAADSWLATGLNQALCTDAVAQALGEDTLQDLSEKTGLNRADLLNRLARAIPRWSIP